MVSSILLATSLSIVTAARPEQAEALGSGQNAQVNVPFGGASGAVGSGLCGRVLRPTLSADGSKVAFCSSAKLHPDDTNSIPDIYVRDLGGSMHVLSREEDGDVVGSAPVVSMSANGSYAFFSNSSQPYIGSTSQKQLVRSGTGGGGPTLVAGIPPSSGSFEQLTASSTGAALAFTTSAALVAGDTNGKNDVYLWNGSIQRVSVTTAGGQITGVAAAGKPSADGRYVVFWASTPELGAAGFYRRDTVTNTTTSVISSSDSNTLHTAHLSADGNRLCFTSSGTSLVPGDTNGVTDVFVRDIAAATTTRVSLGGGGAQLSAASKHCGMSTDGTRVVFVTSASIDPADTGLFDVYGRVVGANDVVRYSVPLDGGSNDGNSGADTPTSDTDTGIGVSNDGNVGMFLSGSSRLVAGDTGGRDAFARSYGQPIGGRVAPNETLGGGGCGSPQVQPNATANPVNAATGNFWHTFRDLSLPGRGVRLELSRTYNSLSASTSGWFGPGWTSTYETSLAVSGTTATVTRSNGSTITFTEDQTTSDWVAPPRARASLEENVDGTWTFRCRDHVDFVFDSTGRLQTLRDLNGYETDLSYPSATQVIATDSSGRTLTFDFVAGVVDDVTDSESRVVDYAYDGSGRLTDVVDVAGGHWQFTYDAADRMLTMRSPRFYNDTTTVPSPVVTNHYDAEGRVDWQTDQLARTTEFDYSTVPGSTIVRDPKGNQIAYAFSFGILTKETRGYGTAQASTWLYEYDEATTATTAIIDPNGNRWEAAYDDRGNKTSTLDPLSRDSSATYSSLDRPLTVTDGNGVTTTMTYDAVGNLLTVSTPWAEGPPSAIQTWTYNRDDTSHPDDVTSIVDPAGKTWTSTYDADGNVVTTTDPLLNTTRFCYDDLGRLTAQISPRGTAASVTCASTPPAAHTTYFTYNDYGDPITTTDPLGQVTATTYDDDRRVATRVDATDQRTTYTYDAVGQLTETERPDSTVLATEFWPDGSVKAEIDGASNRTDFAYDAQGRVTGMTDPLGRATTFGYDLAGNRTALQDPGGNCAAVPKTACTTFSYDDGNQLTAIDYSDPATADVTNISYDDIGHRTGMTDGTGSSTYTWDSLGRLISAASPSGTVGYGWDLRGLLTTIDYPNGAGTVTRTYDDVGRLDGVTDWLNNTTSFHYDADSNLTRQAHPNGTETNFDIDDAGRVDVIDHAPTATPTSPFASFDYGRDDEGKITGVASSGVPTDDHIWTYSAIDQLAGDSARPFPYAYDAADNITQLADGAKLAYDAGGQLTAEAMSLIGTGGTANSSSTTATAFLPTGVQANDQVLVSAVAPANVTISTPTGYTLVGEWKTGNNASNTKLTMFRKTAVGGESQVAVTFSSTAAKTVTAAVYRGVHPTTPIEASSNATSSTSSVVMPSITTTSTATHLVAATGSTQAATTGASWTAPSGMTEQIEQSIASTDGALADQRVTSAGASGTRTATLGVNGKLVGALLALKPATTFVYDTRGNRTSRANPAGTTTYAYDQANRLVSHTAGATTTQYAYNADGLRTARTGTSPTTFQWDTSGTVPLLLKDGTTSYIYGLGPAPIAQIAGSDRTEYHADQLGSVRSITDASGQVVGTHSYDAFGRSTGSTGTTTSPFGFAGQYRDAESGLTYLRARYYDPETAQFIARDPLAAQTGSAYSYAGSNPVNASDPLGLFCIGETCTKDVDLTDPLKGLANFGVGVVNAAFNTSLCGFAGPGLSWSTNIGSATFWIESILMGRVGAGAPQAIAGLGDDLARSADDAVRAADDAVTHGYGYQSRIRARGLEDPVAHNFPYSFDDAILRSTPVRQPDGSLLYRAAGSLNGKDGFYEIAINPQSGTIFHRTFVGG